MANVITNIEADEDLWGTYRVTVYYRNDAGEDYYQVVHNVLPEAVEAVGLALGLDLDKPMEESLGQS